MDALKTPQIDVVIPLFNKEKSIARAVESVLAQTFRDFQIIVVDDGSTDNSVEAVRKLTCPRLTLISQRNSGAAAARNAGIKKSSSGFAAFLDADDAWEPEFLKKILELRKFFPDAGAYATNHIRREPDGKTIYPVYEGIPADGWSGIIPNYFKTFALSPISPLWPSAAAVPVTVFDRVGFFREGEILGEDADMWMRIALKYEIAFSSYPGAVYFMDAENRVSDNYINLTGYPVVKTIDEALIRGDVPADSIGCLRLCAGALTLSTIRNCVISDNQKLARKHLKTLRPSGFRLKKIWWTFWAYAPRFAVKILIKIKRSLRLSSGGGR